MDWNKVKTSDSLPQWKCLEYRVESKRSHYGRFSLSPLLRGQGGTIGSALRRTLLRDVEGTNVTHVKFFNKRVKHLFSSSTILGIEESVHDIIMNLREIVFRCELHGIHKAYIYTVGPKNVTAQDIILPPFIQIVDGTQHIASITKPIHLHVTLKIEKNWGETTESIHPITKYFTRYIPTEIFYMPVRSVTYNVYFYKDEYDIHIYDILIFELWTNGELTPKEALYEACWRLIDLIIPLLDVPLLHVEGSGVKESIPLPIVSNMNRTQEDLFVQHLFIDQLGLPSKISKSLRESHIYRVSDFMNYSQQDLKNLEYSKKESIEQTLEILHKYFGINLTLRKD
uniref:RNA polymerase alpha chain n=1 Tax=Welwitschia mirabilis TaxID=3377 RepID=B2Y1Z1_WELMI|nr:RNA polymerase alpha subunit [Welwitschia mirabilis]ABY26821.1 RNA polymerase alpha subunit [Welwitschia mirabilis]AMA21029.1 RNA polymerase alpha subunit [Welwitschia mirabilis]BAH11197.1 RNA polymerase alpha chain [Welwitschia mirabilis]